MKEKKFHKYSGDNSKEFWNRVNALSEEHGGDKMYCLGVALQNLEGYVLDQLTKSEQEQSLESQALLSKGDLDLNVVCKHCENPVKVQKAILFGYCIKCDTIVSIKQSPQNHATPKGGSEDEPSEGSGLGFQRADEGES